MEVVYSLIHEMVLHYLVQLDYEMIVLLSVKATIPILIIQYSIKTSLKSAKFQLKLHNYIMTAISLQAHHYLATPLKHGLDNKVIKHHLKFQLPFLQLYQVRLKKLGHLLYQMVLQLQKQLFWGN